jgi:AcrR family transcriptional regulator
MGRHADSARERIMDAAEQVVIELGAKHLTFDAVAARSGVSRGGLLYHFPDKKALLKGMIDRLVEHAKEDRIKKRAELPEGTERDLVAHVLSFLHDDEDTRRGHTAALFATGAHHPELLAPLKHEYRTFLEELTKNGLRLERAAVIALATDGLRLLECLSASPFTPEERTKIIEEMIMLAREHHKAP